MSSSTGPTAATSPPGAGVDTTPYRYNQNVKLSINKALTPEAMLKMGGLLDRYTRVNEAVGVMHEISALIREEGPGFNKTRRVPHPSIKLAVMPPNEGAISTFDDLMIDAVEVLIAPQPALDALIAALDHVRSELAEIGVVVEPVAPVAASR